MRHVSFSFSTDVVKVLVLPITCCTRTTAGFLHVWVSVVLFSIHIIIGIWMHLVPLEALYWFITLFFIYDIVISTISWYIGRIPYHWIKLMLYLLELALTAFNTFRWLLLRIIFSSYSFDYVFWHYLNSFKFDEKLILSTLVEKFKENSSFDGLSWSIIWVLFIKSDEHIASTLVMTSIVDLQEFLKLVLKITGYSTEVLMVSEILIVSLLIGVVSDGLLFHLAGNWIHSLKSLESTSTRHIAVHSHGLV